MEFSKEFINLNNLAKNWFDLPQAQLLDSALQFKNFDEKSLAIFLGMSASHKLLEKLDKEEVNPVGLRLGQAIKYFSADNFYEAVNTARNVLEQHDNEWTTTTEKGNYLNLDIKEILANAIASHLRHTENAKDKHNQLMIAITDFNPKNKVDSFYERDVDSIKDFINATRHTETNNSKNKP